MRAAKRFAGWIDAVNTRIAHCVVYLIVPILLITLLEVVLRYVFNRPTIWGWDVNIQLQAIMVALGASYTLLRGKFVSVDVITIHLAPKTRVKLELVTSIVAFFGIGILVWLSVVEAWRSFQLRELYSSLWEPPLYPLKILICLGISLFFLQIVSKFIHNLAFIISEQEKKER